MRLEPISSLADLVFKAGKNHYYKQLATLGVEYIGGNTPKTFEEAMELLCKYARDYPTCYNVCAAVNERRNYVKEDPKPAPAVVAPQPATPKTVGEKLARGCYDEIVAELKKKDSDEQWTNLWQSIERTTVDRSTGDQERARLLAEQERLMDERLIVERIRIAEENDFYSRPTAYSYHDWDYYSNESTYS